MVVVVVMGIYISWVVSACSRSTRQAISDASRNQLLSSSDPARLLSTDKGQPLIRGTRVILYSQFLNEGSNENMVEEDSFLHSLPVLMV
jgi:hypothetical protein